MMNITYVQKHSDGTITEIPFADTSFDCESEVEVGAEHLESVPDADLIAELRARGHFALGKDAPKE